MGKRSYSIRGPVQERHQGRTEYDLAGWGGGGAASDPQMVEEHRACNTQPWFVGTKPKLTVSLKPQLASQSYLDLSPPNFISSSKGLFTHGGRGLLSRLSGEWQGQTGDNFRHFLFFFFQKGTFPPHRHKSRYLERKQKLENLLLFPNICCYLQTQANLWNHSLKGSTKAHFSVLP